MVAQTAAINARTPFSLEQSLPRFPSVQALLESWERIRDEPLAVRALELLMLMYPDCSQAQLEVLSVGERDRVLFWLREQLFGSGLSSVVACPACQEYLEVEFNVHDVLETTMPTPASLEVQVKDQHVCVRLPNALDLVAIASIRNVRAAKQALLERCVLSMASSRSRKNQPTDVLRDPAMLEAINQAMLQADPQAVVELQLNCPNCTHVWTAMLDIASYLWRELDVWAKRTLREVHCLARAYGWTESQILALSPNRRRLYLELVNA
jgi:hypothetical protein